MVEAVGAALASLRIGGGMRAAGTCGRALPRFVIMWPDDGASEPKIIPLSAALTEKIARVQALRRNTKKFD